MAKMKKIILSFLLIITLFLNTSLSVYATSGGGVSRDDLENWDNWTFGEKYQYYSVGALDLAGAVVGCFMHGDSNALYLSYLRTVWDDLSVEDMSFEEWVAMRLGYDSETDEISVDNELVDLMHSACVMYIEEETGWYNVPVMGYKNYSTSYFDSNAQYETFTNLCEEYLQGNMVCFVVKVNNQYITIDNVRHQGKRVKFIPYEDLLCKTAHSSGCFSFRCMKNWLYTPDCEIKDFIVENDGTATEVSHVDSASDFSEHAWNQLPTGTAYNSENMALLNVNSIVRVYKNLDSLKAYSVGQRPYYVTETFTNYDSTVDNSTTITQTEIDNSVTYGDVYNYITNNYENPDGLTEDELRAILAEYLSQINNNGGSGSGSGSGSDSGSSGGGLSGFLSGLGTLGDAILGILGKLIEYVGKAIDLIVNGISGIIEKIPQSITGLMTAAFPFLPEEFFTAIELALILGVVCIVIKIFK